MQLPESLVNAQERFLHYITARVRDPMAARLVRHQRSVAGKQRVKGPVLAGPRTVYEVCFQELWVASFHGDVLAR